MLSMQALKDKKGPSKADTVLVNFHKKCHDLRVRLEELRDHLMQLRDNVGPDRHDGYYSFLGKYDAINKAAEGLIRELKESLTQGHDNFVSVPIALTADPSELPDFLRTKLDPEIERDIDTLHNMYASLQQPDGGKSGTPGGAVTATSGGDKAQQTESATAASGSASASGSGSGSAPGAMSSSGHAGAAGAGAAKDGASRDSLNRMASTRIDTFNEMISKIIDELDGKRLNLATQRPSERPGPVVTPEAEAVIAALTGGQGLMQGAGNVMPGRQAGQQRRVARR